MGTQAHKDGIGYCLLSFHAARCARFCYRKLLAPKSSDEDVRRKEFILNIILAAAIILLVWSNVVVLISTVRGEAHIPFGMIFIILAVFLGLYALSRAGYIRTASYIFVCIYFAGTAYGTWMWGASLPASLLSYGLVISVASVLISNRAGIAATAASVAVILAVGVREAELLVIPEWKTHSIHVRDLIEYSLLLFFTATLSWISSREIEKSLKRARRSEKELLDQNESLERIVEERTRSLKQVQMEKMSQLYRFVEFGRLSSGVFHDLLNPLSSLTSNIQSLQSSLHSEIPEIQRQVAQAISTSKRMERFVDTVRKQIRTQETHDSFSMNEEIEEALMLFEYKARKQKVAINFEAEEKIFVTGNPLKFHQMVANLVSNAIDSYDGMAGAGEKPVDIRLEKMGAEARITMKDHGCGIAPAVIDSIFDPFFTTKPEHQGIGLGLSTTKTVVEKDFGGRIRVESIPGKGSTFTVDIPLFNTYSHAYIPDTKKIETDKTDTAGTEGEAEKTDKS